MLPFGLTTDVSAGALAAGAGGALGAAATAAGPNGGVFAEELAGEMKAAAGQGVPAGAQNRAAAKGADVQLALPAGAAEDAIDLLKKAPDAAVSPQQAGPAVPPEQAFKAAAGDTALAGLAADGLSEDLSEGSEAQTDGETGETVLAGLAPVPDVPAPQPPVGQGDAGGSLPVAAGVAGTVPPTGAPSANGLPAGDVPVAANGQAPFPPAAAGSETAPANASAATGARPETAAQPAVPATATPAVPAAAATGRRWQNELPAELRAAVSVPAQPRNPGAQAQGTPQPPAAQPALVSNGLPGVAVTAAANTAQAGQPVAEQTLTQGAAQPVAASGQAAPAQAQAQAAVAEPPVARVSGQAAEPASGGASAGPATQTPATQTPATQTPATQTPGAPVPASPAATAATSAQPAPAAADVTLTVLADDSQPAAPLPDDGPVLAKPGPEAGGPNVTVKQAGVATTQAAPDGGRGTDARQVQVAAAAVPVAAAATGTEDAELPLSSLEGGPDFSTATVRGGDLHGAVRTESLQTPNQSQSAHVATQVAAEIARNLKNGHTRFQMRFDPPELGRVEVNMRVGADGSVQAHLIVDRPETLDMFLRDQRGLERALEAAGLTPDSGNMQFSLKQDGGQDFASDRDDGGQQQGLGDTGSEAAGEAEPDLTDRVRLMLAEQRGGLDMKV